MKGETHEIGNDGVSSVVVSLASLGILAADIAHEINNRIFVISGNAELLLSQAEEHLKTEKSRRMVEAMLNMSQRVALIARSLHTFSRNSSFWETLDLHQTVDEALQLVERRLGSAKIVIRRQYQPALPKIHGQRSKVEQIVISLALGVRKALPQGGELIIATAFADGQVRLSFSHQGEGIWGKSWNELLDPLFLTSGNGEGLGLGLYLSRKIMEEHRGAMQVESQRERGTTLTLAFPAAPRPGSGEPSPAPAFHTDSLPLAH